MQFTFQQTPEDIKDLNSHSLTNNKIFRYGGIALVCFVLILIVPKIGKEGAASEILTILIPLGLFAVFFVILYPVMLKMNMNTPDNQKVLFGQREMTLTDSEFRVATPDSDTSYKWSAVTKLEESAKSYFLFTSTNQAIILPKRVAQTPAEQAELELLLRSKFPKAG